MFLHGIQVQHTCLLSKKQVFTAKYFIKILYFLYIFLMICSGEMKLIENLEIYFNYD